MRILTTNPNGAFKYIIRGLCSAFELLGHTTDIWDGSSNHLNQFKPDIYIGATGYQQNISAYMQKKLDVKIAIHVNPYGNEQLDPIAGGPDINETNEGIEWVAQQKPNMVFGYGCRGDINRFWDRWISDLGIPTYGVPTAGDHILFHRVSPDPKFRCDLAFVGGYWAYKAININKYLEPARQQFNTVIYGWGGWDNRSKGPIADDDISRFFSSARIGPCICEPHTATYGIDIPERIFKVPLCGLLAVSDPCIALHQYFPREILPIASNPTEYVDIIRYYLDREHKRVQIAELQRKHILKNHTYLNRVQTLFSGLGFLKESIAAQRVIDNLE